MPGVARLSADLLLKEARELIPLGLRSLLLFGVPDRKGVEEAWNPEGAVQQALPLLRRELPGLELITDVCLCSFTLDGHCECGTNDETFDLLAKVALSHARAGAHTVAPSDMMDGRVWRIRKELDSNGFSGVPVMSYAAKYASAYYGPFREAADCAPKYGDRRSYQMDPPNAEEALEEIAADLEEGAESVIVKPALSYLDVIHRARLRFPELPIAAYNVSGEYTMLTKMVSEGLAKPEIVDETLVSIKRAGADRIISYFTPMVLRKGGWR